MAPPLPVARFPLLLLLLLSAVPFSSSTLYSDHCPSLAAAADDPAARDSPLNSFSGYFGGGDPIFAAGRLNRFAFFPEYLRPTLTPSLFHLAGTLSLSSHSNPFFGGRNGRGLLYRVKPRMPHTAIHPARTELKLEGYWSAASGEACLVGNGSGIDAKGFQLSFGAVVSLRYPKVSNISSTFITGSVKCIGKVPSDADLFSEIKLVAYNEGEYEYTRLDEAAGACRGQDVAASLVNSSRFCEDPSLLGRLDFLVVNTTQDGLRQLGFSQRFVRLKRLQCGGDGKVRMYAVFGDNKRPRYNTYLSGEEALVGEGLWDRQQGKLCFAACRVVGLSNLSTGLMVDDCTYRISFWFPAVWSIDIRSAIVGRIWKSGSEELSTLSLQSIGRSRGVLSNLKYNYTKLDEAKKYCIEGKQRSRKGKYPDGKAYSDFAFQFSVSGVNFTNGFASPVSIGERVYYELFFFNDSNRHPSSQRTDVLNISYSIQYSTGMQYMLGDRTTIAAEGIYNLRTGSLCLLGCREVNFTKDCNISVRIQFAPLNAKSGNHLAGVITSLRNISDPLFFEPLNITSRDAYIEQLAESRWRLDIESIMVLVSLTLSCVFTCMQLFHVKKNPRVLPFISITMIAVTAAGYMIPLLLNVEALFFTGHSKQSIPLWSGGWIELNEFMVRVLTLIAFLLQLRLLQVSWNGRSVEENRSPLLSAERKSLLICLPLYIAGGIIVSVVHVSSHKSTQLRHLQLSNYQQELSREPVAMILAEDQHTVWGDLISYAGLILDGFLLPQVTFNAFISSKQNSLSSWFYIGSSVIRAVPHIYDAFRAQEYLPRLTTSYIYADPRNDLYTLAWDIVVPLTVFLLAALIYLQQRFGGVFFLCTQHRKASEYEMVSTVNT